MKSELLKRWHGRMGVISAFFVLVLALTGLGLNHVSSWGFDTKPLRSPVLLGLYGMAEVNAVKSYPFAKAYISQINNQLFYKYDEIGRCEGELMGVAVITPIVLVACESELLVFSPTFELIEKIGAAQGLPVVVKRLGLNEGRPFINSTEGYSFVDLNTLAWTVAELNVNSPSIQWSFASRTPQSLQLTLAENHGSEEVTYERLLLDIHSGRIFGNWGVYLIDTMAIFFILLAISGLVIWTRRKKY